MKRPEQGLGVEWGYIEELEQYADHLEKQNGELLEALRKIIVSSNPNEWTELAFKAIQKAEGGSNELD